MTKEEKKSTEKFFEEAFTGFERGVIDEYAKQKAIEFAEFIILCEYSYSNGVYEIDSNPHGFKNGKYTIEQLYNLLPE